jgi:hypothetical protein
MMSPDVNWPNGMEGGYEVGRSKVKAYWTRQWEILNPAVYPIHFHKDNTGRITVDVHQVVKDLSGNVLIDEMVLHVYLLEAGLIQHMEIRPH